MKRQFLVIAVLFLSILGCDEIEKLTKFNMEFTQEVIIPSSTNINLPFDIFTPDVQTNSTSTFESNDTRKDLIEEIVLTRLDLTLKSPSNADFSFLKSISVYISADGLDEVKIAWNDNVPSDVTVLDMVVTGVDLKEYIKTDKFSLRLNTETDELLTSDHEIDMHSVFL